MTIQGTVLNIPEMHSFGRGEDFTMVLLGDPSGRGRRVRVIGIMAELLVRAADHARISGQDLTITLDGLSVPPCGPIHARRWMLTRLAAPSRTRVEATHSRPQHAAA